MLISLPRRRSAATGDVFVRARGRTSAEEADAGAVQDFEELPVCCRSTMRRTRRACLKKVRDFSGKLP
jgi:hypothetical protein